MNPIKSAPRRRRIDRGTQRIISTGIEFTRNPRNGEAFFSEEEPVRRPELHLVLYDPETAETLTELERRLRELGL